MDKPSNPFDWALARVFVAVAESGSLSGAARALGMSQPTVGRHIHTLETHVGVPLFERRTRGMALTASAQALLPHAIAMRDAANRLALTAAGQEGELAGTVRITASSNVSHHVLPPILARLRAEEPLIQIELVPSDSSENLLFREADIALRMYRPTQLDMVTRHLGDVTMGAFAATRYLERRGRPETLEDMFSHDIIGFDRNDFMLRHMAAQGISLKRENFALRTDHPTAYWELVRGGCGIGFGQSAVGRADPLLEQILLDVPIPSLPIWLTAHEALRHTPRIARVWAHLEKGLRAHLATQVS